MHMYTQTYILYIYKLEHTAIMCINKQTLVTLSFALVDALYFNSVLTILGLSAAAANIRAVLLSCI